MCNNNALIVSLVALFNGDRYTTQGEALVDMMLDFVGFPRHGVTSENMLECDTCIDSIRRIDNHEMRGIEIYEVQIGSNADGVPYEHFLLLSRYMNTQAQRIDREWFYIHLAQGYDR